MECPFSSSFIHVLHDYRKQPGFCNQLVTIFWLMWQARNKFLFQNTPINTDIIWKQRDQSIQLTKNTSLMYNIKWEPPTPGWYKLNIDGNAGIGGIIRNDQGEMAKILAGLQTIERRPGPSGMV